MEQCHVCTYESHERLISRSYMMIRIGDMTSKFIRFVHLCGTHLVSFVTSDVETFHHFVLFCFAFTLLPCWRKEMYSYSFIYSFVCFAFQRKIVL